MLSRKILIILILSQIDLIFIIWIALGCDIKKNLHLSFESQVNEATLYTDVQVCSEHACVSMNP